MLNSGSSVVKREEGLYGQGVVKGKSTETAGNSQTLDQQLWSLHGTKQGPLHVGERFVA